MMKRFFKMFVITAAALLLFSACAKNTSLDSEEMEWFMRENGFTIYDVTEEMQDTFDGYVEMADVFEKGDEEIYLIQFYDLDYARACYSWMLEDSTVETIADGYNYGRAITTDTENGSAYFSFVNERVIAYFYDGQISQKLLSLINRMGY